MGSSPPSKVNRLSGVYGPEKMEELELQYKDLISTLPKLDPPHPTYAIFQYQGFWLHLRNLIATLSLSESFKAQPNDVFICSFPKTGTTWLKALGFAIMTRDDHFDDPTNPLLNKVPHECVPTLEVDFFANPNGLNTELPLLATHLPYACLPKSVVASHCKIIYICREPKDTFASWWHYGKKASESFGLPDEGTSKLEQEVQWFHQGKSMYGPYWDHVLEFWKASVDRPEEVFFLTYEELKSDTLGYVRKFAEFMGKPFTKEEETQGMVEKIVARCNIRSLSNLEVNKNGYMDLKPWKINNSSFFRKGDVGDWKNLLTDDMAKSIDDVTREKFQSFNSRFGVSTQCENNGKN